MLKGFKAVTAQVLLGVIVLICDLYSPRAFAQFIKTIEVTPGVQVNAVAVWYILSCTQSDGLGTFTVVVAPTHGTLAYTTVNGVPTGCPAGGPALPAAQALYTWTAPSSSNATSDYIQLFYQTDDGALSEYIDITVELETPLVIASTLPNGQAGVAYGPATLVSGGTLPYTVSASGLPPGLSVGTNGMVSGTPADSDSGTYDVTVSVTDSAGQTAGPKTVKITISPELVPPVIASMLPNGTAGVAYGPAILVSGGTPPYTVSASGLPPGLSVGTNGMVSGTPAATDSGTYQVTVSVTDSAGEAAGPQTVSIYITPESTCNATSNAASRVAAHLVIATSASSNAKRSAASAGGTCSSLTLSTTTLPPAQAYSLSLPRDEMYVAKVVAVGGAGTYSINVQGLPPGLVVDYTALPLGSDTGIFTIDGRVTRDVPDTYNVTITVTDSAGDSTGPVTLPLVTSCGSVNDTPVKPPMSCGIPQDGEMTPTHGDKRDVLIQQHLTRGVFFYPDETALPNAANPNMVEAPHCTDFTQSGTTHFYYTFEKITSTADSKRNLVPYYQCFDWTIMSNTLTQPAIPSKQPRNPYPYGVGIDAWIYALIAKGDANATSRIINSSYRNPDRNSAYYSGRTTQGAHQFGAAIDLSLFSGNLNEWKLVTEAARVAGFARIEGSQRQVNEHTANFRGPCNPDPGGSKCVHADLQLGSHPPYDNP